MLGQDYNPGPVSSALLSKVIVSPMYKALLHSRPIYPECCMLDSTVPAAGMTKWAQKYLVCSWHPGLSCMRSLGGNRSRRLVRGRPTPSHATGSPPYPLPFSCPMELPPPSCLPSPWQNQTDISSPMTYPWQFLSNSGYHRLCLPGHLQ